MADTKKKYTYTDLMRLMAENNQDSDGDKFDKLLSLVDLRTILAMVNGEVSYHEWNLNASITMAQYSEALHQMELLKNITDEKVQKVTSRKSAPESPKFNSMPILNLMGALTKEDFEHIDWVLSKMGIEISFAANSHNLIETLSKISEKYPTFSEIQKNALNLALFGPHKAHEGEQLWTKTA